MSSYDLRHALAVAAPFPYGSWRWMVALLHDAVEDSAAYVDELERAGVPRKVIEDVLVLTRQERETYEAYIERVAEAPGRVVQVKIADLRANLARLDVGHESLRPRYERALARLEETR